MYDQRACFVVFIWNSGLGQHILVTMLAGRVREGWMRAAVKQSRLDCHQVGALPGRSEWLD